MIYREPEMEIVELKLDDVICLSTGGTQPEGGDNNNNDVEDDGLWN